MHDVGKHDPNGMDISTQALQFRNGLAVHHDRFVRIPELRSPILVGPKKVDHRVGAGVVETLGVLHRVAEHAGAGRDAPLEKHQGREGTGQDGRHVAPVVHHCVDADVGGEPGIRAEAFRKARHGLLGADDGRGEVQVLVQNGLVGRAAPVTIVARLEGAVHGADEPRIVEARPTHGRPLTVKHRVARRLAAVVVQPEGEHPVSVQALLGHVGRRFQSLEFKGGRFENEGLHHFMPICHEAKKDWVPVVERVLYLSTRNAFLSFVL